MILEYSNLISHHKSLDELLMARNLIPAIKLRNVYDIREIGKLHELMGSLILGDEVNNAEIYELSVKLLNLIESKLDNLIDQQLIRLNLIMKDILDAKEGTKKGKSNQSKSNKKDLQEDD